MKVRDLKVSVHFNAVDRQTASEKCTPHLSQLLVLAGAAPIFVMQCVYLNLEAY